MMDLFLRLNILKDSGQIDQHIFDSISEFISFFKQAHGIALTEENGSMLITHLCIALDRIKKGKTVNSLETDIYEEITGDCNFEKAVKVTDGLERIFGGSIPDDERGYIYMHLCVLLKQAE
jgi:transcriptional regulatory protein LevR